MKVYPNLPDNCLVVFGSGGIRVTVTLNVTPDVAKFLPSNRISKGSKFITFSIGENLREHESLVSLYRELVTSLMVEIREAKIKALREEISGLQLSLNL